MLHVCCFRKRVKINKYLRRAIASGIITWRALFGEDWMHAGDMDMDFCLGQLTPSKWWNTHRDQFLVAAN